MVWQNIMCKYFKYERVVIFATNDKFGSKAAMEVLDETYCPGQLKSIYTAFFADGETDFSADIARANVAGGKVFLLLMPAATAGRLLAQGFLEELFKVDTQIFGSESVTDMTTLNAIGDKEIQNSAMKGYIGLRYQPSWNLRNDPDWVTSFTTWTSDIPTSPPCSMMADHTGELLFSLGGHCSGLKFSDFYINGSNIYPFAPHAYDATIALARGLHVLLEEEQYLTNSRTGTSGVDSYKLHECLLHNVSFHGATGFVDFFDGVVELGRYGEGSREQGNEYNLYNFNTTLNSAGLDPFSYVATWTAENETRLCSPTDSYDGSLCRSIIYNTDNGLPAYDRPPYRDSTPPPVLKVGGFFSTLDNDGNFDEDQAQSLAAFLMAIEEINNSNDILPHTTIVTAIREGRKFFGSTEAAHDLAVSAFDTGVDVVVGAGNNEETKASNELFNEFHKVQVHTVATHTDLGIGENFPYKTQTTIVDSFQGIVIQHILCFYFKARKIAVFASNDNLGTMAAMELMHGKLY